MKRIFLTLLSAMLLLLLMSPACLAEDNSALNAVLRAFIEGQYHWSRVEVTNIVHSEKELSDSLPQQISLIKGPPGKAVFKLDFAAGRTETVTASVTAYAPVVRSKRLLRANAVIGPDDVCSSLVDILRLPASGFFEDPSQVIGKTLTRSIASGVTITRAIVSSFPMVSRGQKVTIMIESKNFRITAAGELQESARVGDTVRVMNTSSKKMLSGLLADENTVRIQDGYGPRGGQIAESFFRP